MTGTRSALGIACALTALNCGSGGEATGGTGGSTATSNSSGSTGPSTTTGGQGGAPASGWTTVAPLPSPRQENAVVELAGEIYVIGGFDAQASVLASVQAYDPGTNTWRDVASLPEPRHHVHAASIGGKLYVLGGLKALSFAADGDGWVYDPGSDSWSPIASMPSGTERGGGVVGVVGDEIIVAGGIREGAVADTSAYDVVQDSWRQLALLPEPLDHLAGGAVAGIVYAVGGRNTGIEDLSGDVYAYDLGTDTWSSRTSMLTPRGGTAGAVHDGRLYVFGGEGNTQSSSGVFEEVSRYDPGMDVWTELPAMPIPRHGTGAAALGGIIYVPGGATTQAFGAVDTHEAYIP